MRPFLELIQRCATYLVGQSLRKTFIYLPAYCQVTDMTLCLRSKQVSGHDHWNIGLYPHSPDLGSWKKSEHVRGPIPSKKGARLTSASWQGELVVLLLVRGRVKKLDVLLGNWTILLFSKDFAFKTCWGLTLLIATVWTWSGGSWQRKEGGGGRMAAVATRLLDAGGEELE